MADFATVAELETFMGVSPLGSRGTAMCGHASTAIRLFVQQDLEATTGRQESYAGDRWRDYLVLTQRPVTAVSAITVAGVAFTDFTWTRWGHVFKSSTNLLLTTAWDTGPILVTYDSGFAVGSDEMLGVKTICLEVAARSMGGNPNTFGMESEEVRGPSPAIFLTTEEKVFLGTFASVAVA
jgi:hypothetical protein